MVKPFLFVLVSQKTYPILCEPQSKQTSSPVLSSLFSELISFNSISFFEIFPTKYIFNNEKNKGKKALLEKWGYSIYDADFLKSEIEKQAQLAIQCGEYELDVLDGYGQRIDTVIHLKRKDTGEDVTFVAGWMVYPDGEIVLVTPYGDDK